MHNLIASELEEKELALEKERQVRYFDTTSKSEYYAKPMSDNTVGRWVMTT